MDIVELIVRAIVAKMAATTVIFHPKPKPETASALGKACLLVAARVYAL